MQEIFQSVWDKAWPYLLELFNFIVSAWKYVLPILNNVFIFIGNIITFVKNFLMQILAFFNDEYLFSKPIIIDYAQKNKLLAGIIFITTLLILFFWVKMFQDAKKNEPDWRKLWMFLIVILGPIGALIYFFGRKRVLQKKQWQKEKVMLSFFTPMSKRSNTNENAD